MLNLFIVSAMLFFLVVETKIVISGISIIEKLVSFVIFAFIELYYILQLCERIGL